MYTCSEVGGLRGRYKPLSSSFQSTSSRTVSSEDPVTDEDMESAGVEVGVLPCLFARRDIAERYEVADVIGGKELFDFFLNMEGVGEGGLMAIGEGIMKVLVNFQYAEPMAS